MSRMSVATIDSPEFINITSMSPLVSKCEVKVLYVGENRNRSFITKEVATEMAQTLPGVPIVGYYIENKEDFGDHGDQVIIDGEGVKFKKLTKPYGFVAPDSKIWFQKFQDTDEFGETVVREYLMTEGYLWTGQFEECQRVVDGGNPQSMELDEKTLKGHWSTCNNKGVEFFIINDAMFSKLCILGEDVEPCFEGANVTAPEISSKFSKDDSFVPSLFTMMEQLKTTLKEGGYSMETQEAMQAPVVEEEVVATEVVTEEISENFEISEDKTEEIAMAETQNTLEEFKKADDEEKSEKSEDSKEDSSNSQDSKEADSSKEDKKEEDYACGDKKKYAAADKKEDEEKPEEDKESPAADKEDDKEDEKKKYQLLNDEYTELQEKYSLLETEVVELRKFKAEVEDKEKDEMINSFSVLSDEDKKDVIENKSNYTLDEIESKLSVICHRKKVNFGLESNTEETSVVTTYDLSDVKDSAVELPAWLQAVESAKQRL